MLQQILKDMYVDPDVLDGLNDDQKKTLFLKMRQEQVRRWKEREEKLEREGGDLAESKRGKPRKASSKSVSWLLGRDGDVSVIVIEEDLTFISAGAEEKTSSSLQNNNCHQNILKSQKSTEVKEEKEVVSLKTQPEISSGLKGKCEEKKSTLLPLVVSAAENSAPKEAKELDVKAAEEKSAPQASVCSRPHIRSGFISARAASVNPTPGCADSRPGLADPTLGAAAPPSSSSSSTVKSNSTSASPTKGGLGSKETQKPQESQGVKGVGASGTSRRPDSAEPGTSGTAPTCAGRGRVAQLMKTFSVDTPTQTTNRGMKPPLPTKPSHLRLTTR